MIKRTLGHIAEMLGEELSDTSKEDILVCGVSIDSRTIKNGNLYIPIIGEKFDGRIFIKECQKEGAFAFLIDRDFKLPLGITIPYIRVDDTKKALQDLARAYRSELDLKVIAITGSNGKTTTKNLMADVLSTKYKVKKTQGNLNNDIGLPRSVLSFDDDTEIGILEMGADDFGDISTLTNIAHPDVAIITNIGDSHLLKLKTREGIAKAKLEILEGLKKDGYFIYNGDDEILKKVLVNYDIKQKVISFGKNEDVDFRVNTIAETKNHVKFSHDGEVFTISLLGSHQVYNGSCAVLVAKLFDIPDDKIKMGLLDAVIEENRNELIQCDGFDILNDVYKSNPQALKQGLETAKMLDGYVRKICVLSDMLELGDREKEIHYEVGKLLKPQDIEYALFYGELSKEMYRAASEKYSKHNIFYFEHKNDLIDKLKLIIVKSSLVFIKGSRGMHMEEIVEAISDFRV